MMTSFRKHELAPRALEKQGVKVNIDLLRASRHGHDRVARDLLENGTDPNKAENDDGWTALMLACVGNHEVVARVLLKNGADSKLTSLHLSASVTHIGDGAFASFDLNLPASVTHNSYVS